MLRCVGTLRRNPEGLSGIFAIGASTGAEADVGGAAYRQDGSYSRLLEAGEIWDLVRSGEWYESGYGNMSEMRCGDNERVRDTMASVVGRLAELQPAAREAVGDAGSQAGRISYIVAHQRQCEAEDNQDYSVAELRCILEALRSLSSPWRKLPPELLIEVFRWCLPQSVNATVITSLQAPLLLSQVCSRWQDLCTTTPSLWTSITLTDNFLLREEAYMHAAAEFEYQFRRTQIDEWANHAAELMNAFITRSLNFPISLSVHSGVFLHPGMRKLFHDNASRCKTLALFFPEYNSQHIPNVPSEFFTLESFQAPLLEALDIYASKIRISPYDPWDEAWSSVLMSVITTSARTLRRLNLNMLDPVAVLWHQVDFTQSWENLTHITWRPRISDLALINLFRSAPNLAYASFPDICPGHDTTFAIMSNLPSSPPDDEVRNTASWNSMCAPVVLKDFETLVIGLSDMSKVFNAITLPALRHLVHLSPTNADKDAMIAFFRRSGCPLETLYLYSASYHWDTDLLEVLESVEADHSDSHVMSGERGRKTKGCLKALLISDSQANHGLISDRVLERLTRVPEGRGHSAVRPGKDGATGREWDVLFPSLVYLSFYDSGTMTPGKLPAMLRSRVLPQGREKNLTGSSAPVGDSGVDPPTPGVAKLMMYETWHQYSEMNTVTDEDWEEMCALRELGLLFRVFKTIESRSRMSEAEKLLLRRYVREEGLVVWDYLHDIGQFGPISLEEETRTF